MTLRPSSSAAFVRQNSWMVSVAATERYCLSACVKQQLQGVTGPEGGRLFPLERSTVIFHGVSCHVGCLLLRSVFLEVVVQW